MSLTVFLVASLAAVGSGVAMVLARNSVHAALFLVGTQISLAILFVLQGAFFIAALQIIVYAGAIMVLFIFVVMLLGVDKREALVEPLSMQKPIAVGLGLLLFGEALYLGITSFLGSTSPDLIPEPVVRAATNEGNVEAIGRVLFTRWALPFEATSVLLVVAVVGVMVLAKRGRGDAQDDAQVSEQMEVSP